MITYFLTDRLSVYDLAKYTGETADIAHERAYHLYLLGMVSAFKDMRCHFPLSMNRKDKCGREAAFCEAKSSDNRESGDGRYDIRVERPNVNVIFELKSCKSKKDLEKKAQEALEQIDIKRYGAELTTDKKLLKVGIAFYRKLCKVRVSS